MCSWCWAFRPVWEQVVQGLPEGIRVRRLLGGLAPDSDQPMPMELQATLQQTWRAIQQRVPGTRFDFEFWQRCKPRRSTYPACRSVIAARNQGVEFEEPMILAIQQAYYLQARNPSDDNTLIGLSSDLGLDSDRFSEELHAPATQEALEREMGLGLRLGARDFPSLVFESGGNARVLRYDYLDPGVVLEQLA
ncbi:MAG: DsbA family protein [Gammaproteobacteria bacterium]|nr:DsbA family protein [Gammaproteobacteria bacterium]